MLGEDRWLCTLLLKQGWRIEYAAASDSFTFAPEDFKEFFNQRRRYERKKVVYYEIYVLIYQVL